MGNRKLRKEQAQRKARQKNLIFIGVAAVAVIAVALWIFSLTQPEEQVQNPGETQLDGRLYANVDYSVTMFNDGTFKAELAHGEVKEGTFMEINAGDMTLVAFFTDGGEEAENGVIDNDVLTIPDEWADGHAGHDNLLPLMYGVMTIPADQLSDYMDTGGEGDNGDDGDDHTGHDHD